METAGPTPSAPGPAVDPFPYDTDNDGLDNDVDSDDDNDSVLDTTDDCRLTPDADQIDTDGDGVGDRCDLDADGDGDFNTLEQILGSDPLDPLSSPEYVGYAKTCTNGVDDDRTGGIDAADAKCQDADHDGTPDFVDNCPAIANRGQTDQDGDGLGDFCDLVARVDWVRFSYLPHVHHGTEFYWSATRFGHFSLRSGGSDCSSGTEFDSGLYDPGVFDFATGDEPYSALAIVPAAMLVPGENVLRVCFWAGPDSASATTTIAVAP